MYILDNFDKNLERVLNEGFEITGDRTGVGVRYLPGIVTEMDISERVPVPTRRKTNWKSMLKEYLWFLSGSDNIYDLKKSGSNIWDFWLDDNFTTKGGFSEGSIGYGYGPNLIKYGADLNSDEKGFNQIDYVISELKSNPKSRRILFTFWRPDKLGRYDVKLPPCHHTYQFIVEPDQNNELNKLSCVVYQRSSDLFVGNLSTNLQGAAFYTYMIAQQVGMTPSRLIHMSGHAHIYLNHIPLVEEYLSRDVPVSPILKLAKKDSIYEYSASDFTLEEYEPLSAMKVPIAV